MKFASDAYEISTSGQIVTGLKVRGVLEEGIIPIPWAMSCSAMADTLAEVATPDIVRIMPEASSYAKYFPDSDPSVEVLLLIGRDCGRAMKTECLTGTEPYLHRSSMGYSLVGNVCSKNDRLTPASRVMKSLLTVNNSPQIF